MFKSWRPTLLLVGLCACAISQADSSFNASFDHLSSFRDTSNMYISSTNFQIDFSHIGEDTLYIDSIDFVGDTADLSLSTSLLKYKNPNASDYDPNDPSQYTYNYGDAITGDQYWQFNEVANHSDSSSFAAGEYRFTMNIMGRVDSGDSSLLAALDCVLVVVRNLTLP